VKELMADIPSMRVLGVRVHAIQIPDVVELMERWIRERAKCHTIVVTGMHGVMEARRNPDFKAILNTADLFVPDGISLVWAARRQGFRLEKRVSGSDLMWEFFKIAEQKGYGVFFYGDTEDTLHLLRDRLKNDFQHLKVVGTHSPPFRQLTAEEEAQDIRMINESEAEVVWVGLGLPKQERWMFKHRDQLNAPVVVGVGAAFKFVSGRLMRAPPWVGDHGFEWLWRLIHEPRRVWRRVMIDGPHFVFCVALENLDSIVSTRTK